MVLTLFVNNIPASLHWKGLWHAAGRYGEVVDAFIAGKKSKEGKRFGFVRIRNREDATRVIGGLNNANLFGNKISVSFAKYNTRQAFWKKVSSGNRNQNNAGIDSKRKEAAKEDLKEQCISVVNTNKVMGSCSDQGEHSSMQVKKSIRVLGHVESEDLWKLNRCLVGEMAIVCSVESIRRRLHDWGLGEINVKRLGGKSFILSIEDVDLFKMLEDLNWSYLKEIFNDVQLWSESLEWNYIQALDCNLDCEKMKVLITTNLPQKISAAVELVVGKMVYKVRINELGFSDIVSSKLNVDRSKQNNAESKLSSSSESSRSKAPVNGEVGSSQDRDEALNAACFGNHDNNGNFPFELGRDRSLGESDLSGYSPKEGEVSIDKQADNLVAEREVFLG
ncbi:hypothetical protein GQ457_03G001400 [Hibiscus cannabinus]